MTAKDGQALLERLRNGESIEAIAKARSLSVEQHEGLRRDAAGIEPAVRDRVFAIPRPANEDGVSYDGVSVDDGSYVLIALSRVQDGQVDALEEAQAKQRRAGLLGIYRNSDRRELVEGIRSRLEIKVFEQNL